MKNILKKLHAVMTDVSYIQKDKRNAFHGYNYASEYAIKDRMHEAFVQHGIMFTLSCKEVRNENIVTDKGKSETRTTAMFAYALIDIESGESLEGTFFGSGQDSADKSLYKAVTGAIKYILTSTFLIATGDDPEDDGTPAHLAKPEAKTAPANAPEATYEPVAAQTASAGMIPCPKCGKPYGGKFPRCYACTLSKKLSKV